MPGPDASSLSYQDVLSKREAADLAYLPVADLYAGQVELVILIASRAVHQ